MRKTFKREVAVCLLILMGYVTVQGNAEILEIIVWPIMMFAATAFGMDWAGKQGNEIFSKPSNHRNADFVQPDYIRPDGRDRWWT